MARTNSSTGSRSVRRSAAAAVVAAGLALAACGSDDSAESAPLTAGAAADVLAADTFEATAQTIQGETFDLGQLAGTDLILWFWAPW